MLMLSEMTCKVCKKGMQSKVDRSIFYCENESCKIELYDDKYEVWINK